MHRLVKDQRARFASRESATCSLRAARFDGANPSKQKRSVGRPAAESAAVTALAPGIGDDGDVVLMRRPDEPEAGITDERRTGIADQRHIFATSECLNNAVDRRSSL